jgi:molecular chaperone GrpE (heat shock protein)
MRDQTDPKLLKWPFFIGDCLMLAVACFFAAHLKFPADFGPMVLIISCVGVGAFLAILPFVLEYRLLAKLAEAQKVASLVGQIQNLQSIAAQISLATGQWQNIQTEAEKVGGIAKGLAERMASEVRGFNEFIQKMNDTEKTTLRLEVDKMHRAENDWLQVSVRMLDHVYALHLGATRSGQPNLISQVTNFQNACRDAARKVGLSPFAAEPAEPFDANRHQLLEGQHAPGEGATVAETLATGYTFQGRVLRPALVRLSTNNGHVAADH